jgi:hypothetical protein
VDVVLDADLPADGEPTIPHSISGAWPRLGSPCPIGVLTRSWTEPPGAAHHHPSIRIGLADRSTGTASSSAPQIDELIDAETLFHRVDSNPRSQDTQPSCASGRFCTWHVLHQWCASGRGSRCVGWVGAQKIPAHPVHPGRSSGVLPPLAPRIVLTGHGRARITTWATRTTPATPTHHCLHQLQRGRP